MSLHKFSRKGLERVLYYAVDSFPKSVIFASYLKKFTLFRQEFLAQDGEKRNRALSRL